MNIACVCTRGYTISSQYYPRELGLMVNGTLEYYSWKPHTNLEDLSDEERKEVEEQEKRLRCLPYSNGFLQYGNIDSVLEERLSGVNVVLICGSKATRNLVSDIAWGCEYTFRYENVQSLTYDEGQTMSLSRKDEIVYGSCAHSLCMQASKMIEDKIKQMCIAE